MSLKCQASQDASVLKGHQNTQTLKLMSEMTQKKLIYESPGSIAEIVLSGSLFCEAWVKCADVWLLK